MSGIKKLLSISGVFLLAVLIFAPVAPSEPVAPKAGAAPAPPPDPAFFCGLWGGSFTSGKSQEPAARIFLRLHCGEAGRIKALVYWVGPTRGTERFEAELSGAVKGSGLALSDPKRLAEDGSGSAPILFPPQMPEARSEYLLNREGEALSGELLDGYSGKRHPGKLFLQRISAETPARLPGAWLGSVDEAGRGRFGMALSLRKNRAGEIVGESVKTLSTPSSGTYTCTYELRVSYFGNGEFELVELLNERNRGGSFCVNGVYSGKLGDSGALLLEYDDFYVKRAAGEFRRK